MHVLKVEYIVIGVPVHNFLRLFAVCEQKVLLLHGMHSHARFSRRLIGTICMYICMCDPSQWETCSCFLFMLSQLLLRFHHAAEDGDWKWSRLLITSYISVLKWYLHTMSLPWLSTPEHQLGVCYHWDALFSDESGVHGIGTWEWGLLGNLLPSFQGCSCLQFLMNADLEPQHKRSKFTNGFYSCL